MDNSLEDIWVQGSFSENVLRVHHLVICKLIPLAKHHLIKNLVLHIVSKVRIHIGIPILNIQVIHAKLTIPRLRQLGIIVYSFCFFLDLIVFLRLIINMLLIIIRSQYICG